MRHQAHLQDAENEGKKNKNTRNIIMFILNGRFKQTHLKDAIAPSNVVFRITFKQHSTSAAKVIALFMISLPFADIYHNIDDTHTRMIYKIYILNRRDDIYLDVIILLLEPTANLNLILICFSVGRMTDFRLEN